MLVSQGLWRPEKREEGRVAECKVGIYPSSGIKRRSVGIGKVNLGKLRQYNAFVSRQIHWKMSCTSSIRLYRPVW